MTQKDEELRAKFEKFDAEYFGKQDVPQKYDLFDDPVLGLIYKSIAVRTRFRYFKAALSEPETVTLPDGWVAVEDRLPESKIRVLCAIKVSPNHYDIHDGEFKNGRWRDGAGFDFWGKVTHWMPLPAAPKLNEKG